MLNFSKWILKKWIAAQKREMNGQWHRFFLSLLRWIILAFSLINFTKCNFNRTWNYHVKNKFATKIRCKQNANHFESVINRGQDKHPQYLNEYDIRRLRINIHCRINPRSGKDSFDSLFGQPSTPDSFSHPQEPTGSFRVTCSFSLHFRGKFSFDGEFSVMRPQPTSLFAFTTSDKDESLRHGCGNTRRKIKGRCIQDGGSMWTKIHRSICWRIGKCILEDRW